MKFGLTVNVGNYNSLRCESSDQPTLKECYEECLFVMEGWDEYDAVEYWKNKLIKKISELNKKQNKNGKDQSIGEMMIEHGLSGGMD